MAILGDAVDDARQKSSTKSSNQQSRDDEDVDFGEHLRAPE